jgi:hypothetical protein
MVDKNVRWVDGDFWAVEFKNGLSGFDQSVGETVPMVGFESGMLLEDLVT